MDLFTTGSELEIAAKKLIHVLTHIFKYQVDDEIYVLFMQFH